MTLFYLSREYLYDLVMAVLSQVHLREEPIEHSHRERKAELHLKSSFPHGFVLLTSCLTLGHAPTCRLLELGGFLLSKYDRHRHGYFNELVIMYSSSDLKPRTQQFCHRDETTYSLHHSRS
jgi:hypothetical protein